MPERVLVTGASGLIGRHLVPRLVAERANVVAVSRSPRPAEAGVRWLARDLSKPGSAGAIVERVRPDVLIHLAGAVRGDRSLDAVLPTLGTNLVAGVELLEAATRVGCRRIVLSGSLLEEPAAGTPAATPPSPYGASRWALTAYGRMFHSLFDTPAVILRPSFAYGPGQEATKLIPHVTTALLEGRSPELSSGERLLDCVYADDIAQAYVLATRAAGIEGRTIDLATGVLTSVRDIVAAIADEIGSSDARPLFGRLPVRPLEQQVEVDVDDAARALGWRATTPLDDGLSETVAWFRRRLDRPTGLTGQATPTGAAATAAEPLA
jgi:UDP-glucose 4-epimerase